MARVSIGSCASPPIKASGGVAMQVLSKVLGAMSLDRWAYSQYYHTAIAVARPRQYQQCDPVPGRYGDALVGIYNPTLPAPWLADVLVEAKGRISGVPHHASGSGRPVALAPC